jgi:hypothetical protein
MSPESDPIMTSFADELWRHFNATFSLYIERHIARYIQNKGVRKWIIGTDFCTAEPKRPNDSFCFTFYPAEARLEDSHALLRRIGNRDLKKVKKIPSSIIRALRDGSVFTVCFVADRDRRLFATSELARQSIDKTVEMMRRWKNAEKRLEMIKHVQAFRDKCGNLRLVADVVSNAAMAGYLAFLFAKHGAEMIGWAPDRGDIVEAHNGISNVFFAINVSALCQKHAVREPQLGIFTQTNEKLWCDPYIRIPDYVAGAAAAWDPPHDAELDDKIKELIVETFPNNRYLHLVRLAFHADPDRFFIEVGRIAVSKKPLPNWSAGRRLRGRSKELSTRIIDHSYPSLT